MALTDDDKVKARHHLGYLNVQETSTFNIGVPAGVQTQFMIELSFNKIIPKAEKFFRTLLARLDAIECQMVENTENLAAEKVDEIAINKDEFDQLLQRYRFHQGALANLLGTIPNPFDMRFGGRGGVSGINMSVNHG